MIKNILILLFAFLFHNGLLWNKKLLYLHFYLLYINVSCRDIFSIGFEDIHESKILQIHIFEKSIVSDKKKFKYFPFHSQPLQSRISIGIFLIYTIESRI